MNTLGINKDPKDTRVVVAMSGGVDSSVAAALLHEQGYQVVGITLQLYDHGEALKKKGACCAGQDIHDAKRVSEAMGFEHYVLNYQSKFQDGVIEDFVDSYLKGETPIPCVKCNQNVKFKDLLATARDLGADCMATGHYIQRVVNDAGKAELHRAIDPSKDQSYFLFTTTQEQLDFLRFPLGSWSKDVTRQHAERFGLIVADKPDKRDGRFIENLGSYDPHSDPPSIIVDGEKAKEWLKKGAQPSESAEKLLVRAGVIEKKAPVVKAKLEVKRAEQAKAAEARAKVRAEEAEKAAKAEAAAAAKAAAEAAKAAAEPEAPAEE